MFFKSEKKKLYNQVNEIVLIGTPLVSGYRQIQMGSVASFEERLPQIDHEFFDPRRETMR